MQQRFTILMLFCHLIASPAIGQTTLLTGSLFVQFNSNTPPAGDSLTFAYNSKFQLNERVFLKLDTNGNWNLKTQFLDYVYDAEGNNLYYLVQVMDASNAWINFIRNTYTYDADGNELSHLSERWDTTARICTPTMQTTISSIGIGNYGCQAIGKTQLRNLTDLMLIPTS